MKEHSQKSFNVSRKYSFSKKFIDEIEETSPAKGSWPVVYILSDQAKQEAYVGESTNLTLRLSAHLQNPERRVLTDLHIITSAEFNKSATLEIEASLIKYLSGDGGFSLQNGNPGLKFHKYYQQREYAQLFPKIWDELRKRGLVNKRLEEINNSDLFIYSPYKSLNTDQYSAIRRILEILGNSKASSTFVEGGAGTGKTVLAIFLMKLLVTDFTSLFENEESEFTDEKELIAGLKKQYPSPRVALVVPMTSLRNTLKTVFKNIKGLNAGMVIGPSEVLKREYDILLVDEAHRLRQRKNITNYRSFDANNKQLGLGNNGTELEWICKRSKKQILFYDPDQSVKPSDVNQGDFEKLRSTSEKLKLLSQLRVKGGVDYIEYIEKLLSCKLAKEPVFENKDYEFLLFDSLQDMIDTLNSREQDLGLCRLIAGYAWEWKSKKNPKLYDIEIDGVKLRWNTEFNEWINSDNAGNEVGCIHTTQGYDLNYAGIIFGKEISYDPARNEIVIIAKNYYDKKGQAGIKDPAQLKTYLLNIYKTLMCRGIRGTFVYACDPALRTYFKDHIASFSEDKSLKIVPIESSRPKENFVPLYDIKVAAGAFGDLQQGAISDWIELPATYKASADYFVCKVVGESMNKKIPNGSLCLFQKDPGGSRNGKIVLAQHYKIQDSDLGSNYTLKLYQSTKEINDEGWKHKSISLKPLSNDPKYGELILTADELSDLKIIGVFIGIIDTPTIID